MTPMTRKQKQEAARRLATMNSAIGAIMRLSAEVENIRAQDVDEWLDDLARVEEVAAELGGVEERNILRAMPDLQMIKTQLSAQSSRHRRRNPPLSEHMVAHEYLHDITKLLATRIIAETTERGRDCYGDFIYELSSQIRRQLRDTGLEFGDDERALDLLTDAEEVCSLFNQYRPLAHLLK